MLDCDIQEEKKKFISRNERTFQYDDTLPNLPLPKLENTLRRYLESVRPHVNDTEYAATEKIVREFQYGVGEKLQYKLLERSKHYRNWLEKWWEDVSYLTGRTPIVPYTNMGLVFPHTNYNLPPCEGSQIERAGLVVHYYLKYWKILYHELLPPQKFRNKPFCMNQWRRLFSCSRVPGKTMDEILEFFKPASESTSVPTHVVVLHRGYMYSVDVFDSEQNPLLPPELSSQFQFIRDQCKDLPYGPSVAALTCDNRTSWHENREHLISLDIRHKLLLDLVESSLFTLVLDEHSPPTGEDMLRRSLGGDVRNLWADKSLQLIVHSNGLYSNNNDHAPYDAMAVLSLNYFTFLHLLESNLEWMGSQEIRPVKKPTLLPFKIDNYLSSRIEISRNTVNKNLSNIALEKQFFVAFGKDFITKLRRHPDTFVQLALQLSYYKVHQRPAPTYETATTRQFWHGRTETLRSCTMEAVEWTKSMLNPVATTQMKLQLLDKAFEKHNELMEEGMLNQGCDRHLLGLYLIAQEEGEAIPKLYLDPSFIKSGGNGNYILSTSLSGYTVLQGGVAAMHEHGYGVFYSIQRQSMSFIVTSYKSSNETDAKKLYKSICSSLIEMQRLLLNSSL